MALAWIRLDTGLPDHPKTLSLMAGKKHRAALAYIYGLAYSGRHELDGFIPEGALPFIHATRSDAQALCEVGLWHARQGGWEINSWAEHQPTSMEAEARKERARNAAMKRWHKDGTDG